MNNNSVKSLYLLLIGGAIGFNVGYKCCSSLLKALINK